jgi:hypothetical protein
VNTTTLEPATLRANHAALDELTAKAEDLLATGHDEQAAVWVQIAANFAWMNHTGEFASTRLERVLEVIGDRLPVDESSEAAHWTWSGLGERVLHVATKLYQTGGHTQAICSWMEQDLERQHRVAVTRQGSAGAPVKLLETVTDPDDVWALDRVRGGVLARAAALRSAARGADIVIMHTHNYDVVPTLAFRKSAGLPPVVLIDNNDHTFWIGRSSADVIMHMRLSGQQLAWDRRGLLPEHSYVQERPLRLRERSMDRAAAKAALGLPADSVVITTAADGTKYRPVRRPSFVDLVVPVLLQHPEALLVAAGPSATTDEEWATAARVTGGRVRALGMLADVWPLHQASDIYLDSYPFASLTSMLEAGSAGTPLMTFRGHPASCAVLGADTRCLDDVMVAALDPTDFHEKLADLIANAPRRQALGARTREVITTTHTEDGWRSAVAELYSYAAQRHERVVPREGTQAASELDRLVALVMARTGYATGVAGSVREFAGLLTGGERLRWAVEQLREGSRPGPRQVLPEWVVARAGAGRRRVRTGNEP